MIAMRSLRADEPFELQTLAGESRFHQGFSRLTEHQFWSMMRRIA